jgi:hypothetical protein
MAMFKHTKTVQISEAFDFAPAGNRRRRRGL